MAATRKLDSRSADFPPPLQGTACRGAVAGPWRMPMPVKTARSGNCQLWVGAVRGSSAYPTQWQRLATRKCLFSAKINKWSEMETSDFISQGLGFGIFPSTPKSSYSAGSGKLYPHRLWYLWHPRPKFHSNSNIFYSVDWDLLALCLVRVVGAAETDPATVL